MEAIRSELLVLREREKQHEKQAEEHKRRIRSLQAAIRILANDGNSESMSDQSDSDTIMGDDGEDENVDEDEVEDEDGDEELTDLSKPIYDENDDVFRCTNCSWEVVDGLCQVCGREHALAEGDEDTDLSRSVVTDHDTLNPSRQLAPRGTTPVYDIEPWMRKSAPEQYRNYHTNESDEEYVALMTRGATRKMCERYHLEFTMDQGIVAWADSEIYEVYAGPVMRKGDFWKIYLGRSIDLDFEDIDGSEFMNDLLEEVLMYPLSFTERRWETVEESPGIWATRPVNLSNNVKQDSEDSGDDAVSVKSWTSAYARGENMKNKLNRGPVRRYEEYDTVDDNASDVSDKEELPLGLSFRANAPDAGYDSSEFESDETGDYMDEGSEFCTSNQDEEESSADDDFDSQEEMSGDEDVAQPPCAKRKGPISPTTQSSTTAASISTNRVKKEEPY